MGGVNKWMQDRAGVWHWRGKAKKGGTVNDAAAICLDTRAKMSSVLVVTWFWWNETPCPVTSRDDVSALVDRWHEWRAACGTSPDLLALLSEWSTAGA
jgi:hypothetical protein